MVVHFHGKAKAVAVPEGIVFYSAKWRLLLLVPHLSLLSPIVAEYLSPILLEILSGTDLRDPYLFVTHVGWLDEG